MLNKILPILGGTFDPVHCGHLRLALDLYQNLPLPPICLIPNSTPPHRPQPQADAHHRLKMLSRAIRHCPELFIDTVELERSGPSFFVDTLQELQIKYPAKNLLIIIGMDAFLNLPTWHRWQEILALANFLLVARDQQPPPSTGIMAEILAKQSCNDFAELANKPAGLLYYQQLFTPLPISSTQIRTLIQQQQNPQFLLPDPVWQYIQQHELYGFHR